MTRNFVLLTVCEILRYVNAEIRELVDAYTYDEVDGGGGGGGVIWRRRVNDSVCACRVGGGGGGGRIWRRRVNDRGVGVKSAYFIMHLWLAAS